MDKTIIYKQAVQQLMQELADMMPKEEDGVENQLIIDHEHGHYLIMGVGWEFGKWFYATFVHIDVRENGHVWLQHNGTDLDLVAWMSRLGIPKHDIVLGFHSPNVRANILVEYAKA